MNWLRRNPIFGAVLLACVTVLAAEAWLLRRDRQLAARAVAALEQKKQERDWLARQSPTLSGENEQAIARDVAQAQQVLIALCSALQGKDGVLLEAAPPAKSIDAYFDIAAFVEKTRAIATRTQVMIKPDERFGFASHANEGPEADLVPAVFRQRVAGQYLVEALLESRPRALLAVQREHPLTAAQQAQRNRPSASGVAAAIAPTGLAGQPGDFFDLDGQISLRVPGRVESEAFRLEFTGQTPALRALLNSLAAFKLPAIVRSVEVEPLAAGSPATAMLATGAPVPLVPQNMSKFSVVVELIEPLPAAEKEPAS
ncbi:MAG TPA: Amuc_1100 family pilus-like protein [Lacunisphaera sp.]|nr:Amuc_1100 family pilus-like protein [Lacunisphaera sp.]